jgi:hypothetical protein
MTPLQRNARRRHIQRFAKEIHNVAACLTASQAAIGQKSGLNAERWRALAAIDRSSFTLSISGLARQLRRSRQSVHPLALSLERAGWVPGPSQAQGGGDRVGYGRRRLLLHVMRTPARRLLLAVFVRDVQRFARDVIVRYRRSESG